MKIQIHNKLMMQATNYNLSKILMTQANLETIYHLRLVQIKLQINHLIKELQQ